MKRTILPALIAILVFSGCNKWLEVQPSNQISDTEIFGDASGVRNALNGVYQAASGANLYGRQLTWGLSSVLGQDYDVTKITGEYQQIAALNFTHSSVVPVLSDLWGTAFNVIANCNKIINEVEKKDSTFFPLGNTEKNLVIGEALAMRALLHFELLRLYAPSPLNDKMGKYMPYQQTYPALLTPPVSTNDIIKNVLADLDKAQGLVANNDTLVNKSAMSGKLQSLLNGSSTLNGGIFFSFRMNRLNYVAIHGLMARVYLYNGDRVNAKKEAEYLYKDFGPSGRLKWWAFTTENNSKGVNRFPKLADDIILAFYDPNVMTAITAYKNTTNTFALADVPTWFPAAERDYRANIISTGNISDKWVQSLSMALYVPQQNTILPVLRFSEIYYIYSECLFEEGNTGDALKILNEARYARGKTTTFTDASREGFYNELFSEYRREFLAEGQTVFAYKRLNRTMITSTKQIVVDNKFVFPLPDGEKNF